MLFVQTIYYWAACGAQLWNGFSPSKKRQNSSRYIQKALRVSIPLQQSRFLGGGDRSFQVVWATDLEIDLERTQNYFVKLLRPISTPNDYLNAIVDDVISLC